MDTLTQNVLSTAPHHTHTPAATIPPWSLPELPGSGSAILPPGPEWFSGAGRQREDISVSHLPLGSVLGEPCQPPCRGPPGFLAWGTHAGAQPGPALPHSSARLVRHRYSSCLVPGLAADAVNMVILDSLIGEGCGERRRTVWFTLRELGPAGAAILSAPSSPSGGPIGAPPPLFVFRPDFLEPGKE